MRGSLKIAAVAGIGIYVHWTFVLLIGWVIWMYMRMGQTFLQAMEGVGLVLAIFVCVVLHELGHALMARRFGIGTRDITLLPIGGVARLERMPEKPMQEFLVALAGPAVNVVIAALLLVVVIATGQFTSMERAMTMGGEFLMKLLVINIFLVVFNMIPAFPMDGGRVLRAILAIGMDYAQATQIAAIVGQSLAVVFAIFGVLIANPFLIFIAVFVFLGARAEAQHASLRSVMRGMTAADAMMTDYVALPPDATIGDAVEFLRRGSQHDFPIVENGEVAGTLSREAIIDAYSENGPDQRVDEVMRRDCPAASSDEPLEQVFQRMRENDCTSMGVKHDGELVGFLTLDNVGELMMIRSATRARSRSKPPV